MNAGKRDRRVTIQSRTETQEATYGTISVVWTDLATVWAEVQDVLPSRAEKVADGISMARRPCRIRMLYRSDLTSEMRIKYGTRYLRIVSGPAELGRREGLEIMAEELSTEGTAP